MVSFSAPLAADYCATDILTVDLMQDDPKRVSVLSLIKNRIIAD